MTWQLPSFRAEVVIRALTALALTNTIGFVYADALTFQDVINSGDPTFNQELGINNSNLISGYFGSGAAGSPNKGYTVPYSTANPITTGFTNENFPGSVQTQVTGINNIGTTTGFFSNTNLGVGMDNNFGFVDVSGTFTEANNPNASVVPATGLFTDQLLGVNDSNLAVGFYVADDGTTHGYTYDIGTKTFSGPIDDPNGVGATTAAAINNSGEIAGFFTNSTTGVMESFLDIGGTFTTVFVPGSTSTVLTGLNNKGEAVGFDTTAAGMFGIVCNTITLACTQHSDPNGVGFTTFNGLNDNGKIVGFYVNGAGNTIGLVATPEPSMFLLTGCGILLIGFLRRRRA